MWIKSTLFFSKPVLHLEKNSKHGTKPMHLFHKMHLLKLVYFNELSIWTNKKSITGTKDLNFALIHLLLLYHRLYSLENVQIALINVIAFSLNAIVESILSHKAFDFNKPKFYCNNARHQVYLKPSSYSLSSVLLFRKNPK